MRPSKWRRTSSGSSGSSSRSSSSGSPVWRRNSAIAWSTVALPEAPSRANFRNSSRTNRTLRPGNGWYGMKRRKRCRTVPGTPSSHSDSGRGLPDHLRHFVQHHLRGLRLERLDAHDPEQSEARPGISRWQASSSAGVASATMGELAPFEVRREERRDAGSKGSFGPRRESGPAGCRRTTCPRSLPSSADDRLAAFLPLPQILHAPDEARAARQPVALPHGLRPTPGGRQRPTWKIPSRACRTALTSTAVLPTPPSPTSSTPVHPLSLQTTRPRSRSRRRAATRRRTSGASTARRAARPRCAGASTPDLRRFSLRATHAD